MTDTYDASLRGPQFDAQKTPAEGGEARKAYLMSMFDRWDVLLLAKWSAWREEAQQAYDFAAGHQWSPADRSAMEENQKIPVVFNITAPTLDAVNGAEIQNRQQVQYYPREVGDQGVADALTQGAEYVSDECNGDQEDSEAFYDTLVCGIGWTVSQPEVEGDELTIRKERVDPLEMLVDPSSRKPCFEDKRYLKREWPMSRDEFDEYAEEIGASGASPDGYTGRDSGKRLTIVNPQTRYTSGMLGTSLGTDEVVVCEWQWFEKRPVFLAPLPSPQDGNVIKVGKLSPDDFAEALKTQPDLKHTRSTEKVFYRAIVADGDVLFEEELPEKNFRYTAITGKRDRNAGTWFGLVRAMLDPQKFTNKLYSEILHIVRTNANGGLLMEEDAVADIRKFEATWASADKITWLKPGSLSNAQGPKVSPKTPPPINPSLFSLMEFAKDMVRACTGVNEEILGIVGREQAGVLEQQRKQAAYGILSAFFDSKRRYQRENGRLLLAQMREFLPDDKLVRIVDKGTAKYVQLAKTLEAQQYDIVVDEAPAGPNQKAKVMAVLGPLLPEMYAQGIIGAAEIADMLPYMDIPAAVADKLAAAIRAKAEQAAQPNPQAQQEQAATVAGFKSDLENQSADTAAKRAKAFKDTMSGKVEESKIGLDRARETTRAIQDQSRQGFEQDRAEQQLQLDREQEGGRLGLEREREGNRMALEGRRDARESQKIQLEGFKASDASRGRDLDREAASKAAAAKPKTPPK